MRATGKDVGKTLELKEYGVFSCGCLNILIVQIFLMLRL